MCLIGVAVDLPGPWLLALAANRDEFHERTALPARYWNRDGVHGGPEAIFAGQDLQGGGTWLGLRRSGQGRTLRVAALTNLRPGLMPARPGSVNTATGLVGPSTLPPSRGHLVRAFLAAEAAPAAFLQALEPPATAYAGFNLLALTVQAAASGSAVDACYLNNLPAAQARRLDSGIHVVSNATLDVPWSKTVRLREAVRSALDAAPDPATLQAHLFAALDDRTPAADSEMPQTGLDPARERLLSAPFIVDDVYGTRCSTVIVVTRAGEGLFCERSFGPGGQPLGTVTERFRLGGPSFCRAGS